MQSDIDQENSLSLNEPITESAVSIRGRFALYGVVLEMPQKVCGGDILHVMAFAKKFEMPQNRTVSVFLFFSVRNLITCLIFEMPHFRINIGSNASNVS